MVNIISKESIEEKVLIKRNNQAPGFSASLAGNRSQMIIERYIQWKNIDVQDYINSNRMLTILIPIITLRQWYPGPNWKKDIAKVCIGRMKDIKKISLPNGNFKLMNLFSYAELSDDGLVLDVAPKVLQLYNIDKGTFTTSLDYDLTTLFESKFSHEMYWEICKHDNPRDQYRFFLTPDEINAKYVTKYNVTNILKEILLPTQAEIKKLYDQNLSPRFFTFEERREIFGKCKKVVGWEFTVYNEVRAKRQDLQAQEAYRNIDSFLQIYLDKYRINILGQIKSFSGEKIIRLWMRLEMFDKSDKSKIRSVIAYLCAIFPHYGIDPHSSPKEKISLKDMPLFEKEEKDLAAGLKYWLSCTTHINESTTASPEVKETFNKLRFYSYSQAETGYLLILSTDEPTCSYIRTYYAAIFEELLQKYFPANLTLKYYVTKQ